MKKLTRIEQIERAALDRRAVVVPKSPCFHKPIPAAFIINLQGHVLCRLLAQGMYLYRSNRGICLKNEVYQRKDNNQVCTKQEIL